jgi:16S rRNA (cytosine967-C5)-methyltransferase
MSVNEREIVLDILMELEKENAMLHLIMNAALSKYQYLKKQQRSFITRTVNGTIEKKIEIDYIIDSYSKTPVKKMKPLIRNLLEMSVYQLKYMDSVPVSAVCNEAVKLAQKRHFTSLKGFVNGVLRNIARNEVKCEYPDRGKEFVKYLSVKYSMPEWIIKMWQQSYSDAELESILNGFNGKKITYIRCNTNKLTVEELKEELKSEGVTVKPVDNISYALAIEDYDYLLALESFRNGHFYVQDLSSMLAGQLAAPKKGDFIIDVCAAPGGKSMNVALLEPECSVQARDLSDVKVARIEENLERMGIKNVSARVCDATQPDTASFESADIVLADLPCSGLGVIGRKPDIKYNVSPDGLTSIAELQRQILSVVWQYVKPGGHLIYSTCTINRAENEENVEWFVKNYPFEVEGEQRQLLPGKDGTDGFFTARLIRKER